MSCSWTFNRPRGATPIRNSLEDAFTWYAEQRTNGAWALDPLEELLLGPALTLPMALDAADLELADVDVVELHEAFAAQGLATLRQLGVRDDAEHVNPNGGAIALGHPLGMSGARLVTTAARQLQRTGGRYALCTMCIGVGQGIAMIIERVDGT